MTDQNILKVNIHGKSYPISCKKGEEDRVRQSAVLLNEIIDTIDNQDDKISENRILLMASLILADKNLRDIKLNQSYEKNNTVEIDEIINWLEQINLKFNKVASLLDDS